MPYAFRRFSLFSASRTLMPTLGYYLKRPALSPSDKPALCTMNILPPMMTVWHHCARKYLGDAVDITVFDCSGRLNPAEFPGVTVRKFLNLYAATKCDEFIRHIARNRNIAWICDDDIFFISPKAVDYVKRELANPQTASVSFRPRTWWDFDMDGKRIQPSGSYCLALNREIFWDKERLTLAPAPNNRNLATQGVVRSYDTFDKANELLLEKGYRCTILPPVERDDCVTGFSGMSGAVMMLYYFKMPEQILEYYRNPPEKAWLGNVLPGTLAAMLAVCTVQECYQQIMGKAYPLPSLPSRGELEKLRAEKTPFLRKNFTAFHLIDEGSERLRKAVA